MQYDTRKKIMSASQAAALAKRIQFFEGKVVFTNGCFDILHAGHARYLAQARDLGDCLVVGLNSDASVKSLGKGGDRPLNSQKRRAEVLSALVNVNAVVIFDEPDPHALISRIVPDVLVKGGDWAVKDIIGADVVTRAGGRVLSIPLVKGESTTSLVRRIRSGG